MTTLSASTSQQTLLAANSARKGMVVFNQTPAPIYISTVSGFAKVDAPNVVDPDTRFSPTVDFTGTYYVRCDATTGTIHITEY